LGFFDELDRLTGLNPYKFAAFLFRPGKVLAIGVQKVDVDATADP
jgi:hypothetical protein